MKTSPMIKSSLAQQGAIGTRTHFRRLVRVGFLLPMLVPCSLLAAQETNDSQNVHRVEPPQKRQRLEERVERLGRYLDANEGQKSELKNILREMQQEILNMRRAPAPGEELQMDRLRSIEDKAAEKIRAILNEEQREKYDQLGIRNSNSAAQDTSVKEWLKEAGPR